MASEIKANKISPATGTAFTLGDSGDTFTIPSGVTLTNNGSSSGFDSGLASVQYFYQFRNLDTTYWDYKSYSRSSRCGRAASASFR